MNNRSTGHFHLTGKENQQPPTRTHTHSTNFGKSVRCRAQMNSQPLCLQPTKQPSHHRYASTLDDQFEQPVRVGLRRTFSVLQDCQEGRGKTVRFEDEEEGSENSFSSRKSCFKRGKNSSILKKGSGSDVDDVLLRDQAWIHTTRTWAKSTAFLPRLLFETKAALVLTVHLSHPETYQVTLKRLKEENSKFIDKLFPPGEASLCFSKQRREQLAALKWMRAEEIFKNNRLVMYSQQSSLKCQVQTGYYDWCSPMAVAFNALSNSNRCLTRIFQQQKPLGLCVYYLRLNHDGIWKYLLVDDYLPVVQTDKGPVPAFLNVLPNHKGQVELWPLLLQKCLAKMYSCYECLFEDSVDNLLYQLTGYHPDQLDLNDPNTEHILRNMMLHGQTVSVLQSPLNKAFFSDQHYAVRADIKPSNNNFGSNFNFNCLSQDSRLRHCGSESRFSCFGSDMRLKVTHLSKKTNLVMQVGDLKKQFQKISVFRIEDSYYSVGCVIQQRPQQVLSIRKFTVCQQATSCVLTLAQKDKKYYRNNGYDYAWTRMMLVTKDGKQGYRWIAGKYQQQRASWLSCQLEPGDYLVVVTADWRQKAFEMTLNLQSEQPIEIVREPSGNHPLILQEVCVDLAQRFGSFRQINRNLCSYCYIDKTNGFIIQNINNEVPRTVFYFKEYQLKGKSFELIDKEKFCTDGGYILQAQIGPNANFNFIVKMLNGYDPELLESFTF